MLPSPRLELLGAPRLVLPLGQAHVLERRDAALLAWLALRGPTPRSRLLSLLWPDLPTGTAQTNLRQRLFRLRQRAGGEIFVSTPLMALAEGVVHDLSPSAPELNAAPRLGPPALLGTLDYADCDELAAWVAGARESWSGEWRTQLARHAAQLESEGRIAEALAFAERLTLEAPTAEHAHRRLMRLHYRRGDRSAALAAFAHCRAMLSRQLGTRPGAETLDLATLIERSGALPPPVAAPSPVATLRPPRLIGRDAEWRAIESAWQRREAVLLLGEPGMGKSRLAADFAAAQHQPHVHRAYPGDARMPYSLLARLLRGLLDQFGTAPDGWVSTELSRLLPELGAQPAGRLEPLRLRQAVVECVAHWQARGLEALVIDDLHCADEASLELLLAWLDQTGRPQVIVTSRPGEMPAAMGDWLRHRNGQSVCEVALAPLGLLAIVALLDSLAIPGLDAATWATPLARHSGGNPLFILETLKARRSGQPLASGDLTALSAPAHIGKLMERRLEQLTPGALRLARVAALAGADFSADLAARVLGGHVLDLSEAWLELERAHIVTQGAFAHDLILEATQRSVPEAISVALHRAMALALEAGTPAPAPARLAHHWHGAHDWARAAPQFELAAKAAHRASRPAEALVAWDAAAACHAQAGADDAAFAARCAAVDAAIAVGPADAVAARVEALVAESRSDAQRLSALIAQAQHLSTGAAFGRVTAITAEALAIARRLGHRRQEFMAVNLHGVALTMTGQQAAGLALFDSMAAAIHEAADEGIEAEFCSALGYALHAGGRERESVAWFERAAEIAQRLGETQMVAINLGNLAGLLGRLGPTEQALEAALRARAVHARLGDLKGEPFIVSLVNVGMFQVAAGRFDEAQADFQHALDLCRAGSASTLARVIEHHLANLFLLLGQPARARQTLSALQTDAPSSVKARRAVIEWRISAFATRQAPDHLQLARHELASQGTATDRLGLELALCAALPAEDSLTAGLTIRAEALANDHPAVARSALIRVADALRRLGRPREAADAARTAAAEAAGAGLHDLPSPEFWWLAFQAFDSAGSEAEALQALRTGADWVTRAAAHVPAPFRESYLHRGLVVPQLLSVAARRLGPDGPPSPAPA